MTEPARIRNCYELCRSTLRNAAYYRGGANHRATANAPTKNQFAIVASNNFIDMTYLDWYKLFADAKGEHHWTKILPADSSFGADLLAHLNMTAAEFDQLVRGVKHYRDKVVAHADVYEEIILPVLEPLIASTIFLYERLRDESGHEPQPLAPFDLNGTFQLSINEGQTMFSALAAAPDPGATIATDHRG